MAQIDAEGQEVTRQVARAAARKAAKQYRLFETFAQRVWKHLGLPALTPVQVDMARYLQFGPAKRMLQAFRGIGKSWLTAAFVVWNLLRNPQLKVLIVSASKDYADTMSVFIKRLIDELPECAFLKPRTGQRNSLVQFDVGPALADKSPSVKSVGIFGQTTGSRAGLIVVDDIEVPKNSMTPLMRERLSEQARELNDVLISDLDEHGNLLSDEERPSIVYLGTPQTEMSYYNKLPERGYDIRIWPSRVPGDIAKYQGRLAPFVLKLIEDGAKPGTPIDPKRFDHRALYLKETEAGKSRFALQYQLDTSLSDALKYPLRCEDLMVMSLDGERAPVSLAYAKDPNETLLRDLQPVGFNGDYYYRPAFTDREWAPFTGCVMSVDPSGRGADEIGYAVIKMLMGRLFLVASGGLEGGYEQENLQALADIAKKHAINTMLLEENFGDGMFGALLKPVLAKTWPCSVEGIKAVGQKELRIIGTLEPVLNQHKLVVDAKVIELDLEVSNPVNSLFYQLTRITKERGCLAHDDRLDALEMAVRYWQSQMDVDEDKAAEAWREEQDRQFFEEWEERTKAPLLGHNGGPALGDEDWDAKSGNMNWMG